MKINQRSEKTLSLTIVAMAILVGGYIRLSAPLASDFPLNDGGLFYAMTDDLRHHSYLLPETTSYNDAGIPFAYPPLAFYIAGLLTDLTGASLLEVMRLLPALVSALCIPAFYLLAKDLTKSRISAAIGTLIFALTPRAFIWHIMGGGITRSFGLLFALLTLHSAYRLFTENHWRRVLSTAIWGTLVVLTHPEASIQTAIAASLLFLFFGRTKKGLSLALTCAGIIAALTTPWWGRVLQGHGAIPFISVFSSAHADSDSLLVRLVALFRFDFTEETLLPLIAILGLFGVCLALARSERFLPVWLVLAYLLEPRGGQLFMMLPLALLAAQALTDLILPRLSPRPKFVWALSMFLFFYSSLAATLLPQRVLQNSTLTEADQAAFNWIRENTPADSRFLILSGGDPFRDPVSEWFPPLTGRVSAATVFGYEWVNGNLFAKRMEAYRWLQTCMFQDLNCIRNWSEENKVAFTHILLRAEDSQTTPLQIHLNQDSGLILVYRMDNVFIYRKK